MRAKPFPLESSRPVSGSDTVPFASEFVTLTRQEHIELVMQAHYFRSLHERAVARAAWREDRYQRVLHQMKAQGAQREAALRAELEAAHAHIRDLQQRLFGRKTERHPGNERQAPGGDFHAPRGHSVARRAMAGVDLFSMSKVPVWI